jgi:L-alanine-DL-glutamate epimerase-like enolase superfamily enzyme
MSGPDGGPAGAGSALAVLAEPSQVRDGTLLVRDVPGNGLEWDEGAVNHYRSSN